jgi:hypothetical protein
MSQPFHVTAQPEPPKPPIVRLPTWVNVVLVLILLASCGGDRLSAGSVADEVVQRVGTNGDLSTSGLATQEDVIDMCRLLGTVLVSGGTSPGRMFSGDGSVSACEQAAQEAATSPGTATP